MRAEKLQEYLGFGFSLCYCLFERLNEPGSAGIGTQEQDPNMPTVDGWKALDLRNSDELRASRFRMCIDQRPCL
jgi:hypothetical protein